MPATITFADARALVVFHGMVEGREEVQRDNGGPDDIAVARRLTKLLVLTGASMEEEARNLTIVLPDDLVEQAEISLENCLDDSSGLHPGDAGAEDYLFLGQVVIQK
jgi:hypothetical protein